MKQQQTLRQEQEQKAIECLNALQIYNPYINGFKKDTINNICLFEQFGGFWVYQYPELIAKVKEIEAKYGCKIYAITHEIAPFGEMYSFLYVSKYEEDREYSLIEQDNVYYASAYVWNKSYEYDSEFGTIGVQCFGGGIRRVYEN